MRTEHLLFLVLGISPKSRAAKVCAQWHFLQHEISRLVLHTPGPEIHLDIPIVW